MSEWQILFGTGIGATAVVIFLGAVAGELAIVGDLLDRMERRSAKLQMERRNELSEGDAELSVG